MACCIVIGLVIATVRRAWFALLPSRAPREEAFAPVARRPAPGHPASATPAPAVVQRRAHRTSSPDVGTALIAAGAAWLVLTEVTAHGLHLVPHSDLLHAPGPIVLAIGLALRAGLVRPRPFPRPVPTR